MMQVLLECEDMIVTLYGMAVANQSASLPPKVWTPMEYTPQQKNEVRDLYESAFKKLGQRLPSIKIEGTNMIKDDLIGSAQDLYKLTEAYGFQSAT